MEQILLYLYGGVMEIDPCYSMELVRAGDMYGMEGLNTLVNYNLRKTLCHFFHRVWIILEFYSREINCLLERNEISLSKANVIKTICYVALFTAYYT